MRNSSRPLLAPLRAAAARSSTSSAATASAASSSSVAQRRTAAEPTRRALRTSARVSSYYPPPEPFFSAPSPDAGSSASRSASPLYDADVDSPGALLSTFGADGALLSAHLARPPTSLTLRSLLALGGSPGSTPSRTHILQSARFTAGELPLRLARRVAAFRELPFIVGSNPHIQAVARLYAGSFQAIASLPRIADDADNERFTRALEAMVQDHAENIPTLARGFLECKRYMSPAAISAFLDGAIHSRIGIRLIAEQHLALSASHTTGPASKTSVGIIDTCLSAAQLVQGCADFVGQLCESSLGCAPELILEGDTKSTFVGVASHLTYTVTELLKNSYRATAEKHGRAGGDVPPVRITIARSRKHLTMRIRDEGGGISPQNFPKVFQYTFTTASFDEAAANAAGDGGSGPYALQQMGGMAGGGDVLAQMGQGPGVGGGMGTLAGLGYGLPMSRIYAQHGRGSLDIVSIWPHGCDSFLAIRANPLDER